MRITTRKKSQYRSRLGDLFLEANIISPQMLAEGLRIAGGAALPLGRVLVMTGYVAEHDVKAAIDIQLMVRNGELAPDHAIKALRLCHCSRISVEQALEIVGYKPEDAAPIGQLGRMLLKAELVDATSIENAAKQSCITGESLGRILVLKGLISPLVLSVALNILVLVRDGKLTMRLGILLLRKTYVDRISLAQALESFDIECETGRHPVKLGTILSAAGCLPESDTVFAVEIGLEHSAQVGWVLVETGLVSEYVIDAALQLQSMINIGTLSFRKAVEILRLVESTRESVDTILAKYQRLSAVAELLVQAEIICEQKVREYRNRIADNDHVVLALLQDGVVQLEWLDRANACLSLVADGKITKQQAVEATRLCNDEGDDFFSATGNLACAGS